MIVGINCGHTVSGSIGSGASGILDESNETRNVGRRLEEYLQKRGVTVVDCTNDYAATVNENLSKITAMANARNLDLFVSIHFNSGGGRGSEVYTYGARRLAAAERVCENMQSLGFVNRGIKDGSSLYVVRRSKAAAMLVEVCFVDTASDAELYRKVGADAVARAIGDAITGEKEELTMTQYDELKQLIAAQNAKLDAMQNTLNKSQNKMIYNYVDKNMPEWAREAVQWCMDNGIVAGDGNGLNLDDNKLWTCVIIYRLASKLK